MTACLYEGAARNIVRAFKYAGADYLAPKLARSIPIPGLDDPPEAVIAVPSTRRERREKGFEPAALLAAALARRAGLPLRGDVLRKTRETRRQARLSLPERRRNVAGAFESGRAPTRVLLVDDVVTSGATLAACARALVRAGARRVTAAAFARALPEFS
jgi:predicted amidophosphoribosyltransferase